MIYGHIAALDTYSFLLVQPAWKKAFDWIKTATPGTTPGVHKLQGDEIYANVHGYSTLPREQCRYENHHRYVDLQYCITGGELIDWQLATVLQPDGPFNSEKDLQFYQSQGTLTIVQMKPGSFAIFFPPDGHAPKRNDGTNSSTFKVVVKIDRSLLS